ncbi:MAG: tetratricopeptide repeat protein [Phycisphaerae bacterium]
MLDLSQPFSEGSNVILLPRSADFYEARNRESDIEAFKPFVDNGLLRSSKGTLPIQTQDIKLNSISTATTTAQGAFYAAQQISRARNYIRQGMYEQALNCYQAARDIDEKNTNSLIGIIYCHIMSGKFQVGGLCVLRLFEQSPDFWRQEPDFIAIFSVSRFDIVKKTLEVEPEIDRLFKLYHVNDGNQVSEDLKQVYLSKTFIAWLKGDSESMKINITAAAKMAPLDGSVQQLYRGLTATK